MPIDGLEQAPGPIGEIRHGRLELSGNGHAGDALLWAGIIASPRAAPVRRVPPRGPRITPVVGARGQSLQRAPVDLAARVDGKAIDEDESPRNLVRRERLGAPLADGERRERRIRAHEKGDHLLPARVARHAEHPRVGNARQLQQPALDLCGIDLAARDVDQRRDAPGEDEPARRVQMAEVAGEESAVAERRDRIVASACRVAGRDGIPLDEDAAGGRPGARAGGS